MSQPENLLADLGRDSQFFLEFPPQRSFEILARFHLATGKLPLEAVGVGVMPLADEDPVAFHQDTRGH